MAKSNGSLYQRIRYIKSSLDNAEQSFLDNKSMRGELDLMLAEAEFKNLRRKKDVPWNWNRQLLACCAALMLLLAGFGGWYSRGIFDFCFDPVNEDRVLAFGGYPGQTVSSERSNATNGIYLSEDRGKTWKQVLVQKGANMMRDFRQQIAYDKTSYDEEKDRCMVAYWSRPWHLQEYPKTGRFFDESLIAVFDGDQKGLWKTEDGGETWFLVNSEMSDGVV